MLAAQQRPDMTWTEWLLTELELQHVGASPLQPDAVVDLLAAAGERFRQHGASTPGAQEQRSTGDSS